MSPPPPRGRRRGGDDEFEDVLRRRKRRRLNGKGKRKRRATLILGALLVIVLAMIASGVGAVAAFRSSCDLTTLRPVEIGQNSFVFAGERLPARLDPGGAKPHAGPLVAGEPVDAQGHGGDRGSPLLPARWRRLRGHRARRLQGPQRRPRGAGRLDDHPAAGAQPLHLEGAHVQAQGEGGLPRDQALPREEQGLDPRPVHEPGLLRQPRLRDRGRGADLLLEARQGADARPGRVARRPAAGADVLRPAAPSRGGLGASRQRARGDVQIRRHHRRPVPGGDRASATSA